MRATLSEDAIDLDCSLNECGTFLLRVCACWQSVQVRVSDGQATSPASEREAHGDHDKDADDDHDD